MHVMPVCGCVCMCVCMCYSPDQGSLVVDMRSHNSRTAAKPSDSLRECSTRPPSNLCTQQRQYIHERDENNMYTTIVLLCVHKHVHVVEYREQVQSRILHVHKYVHGMHICEIILFTDELAKSALQCIIVSDNSGCLLRFHSCRTFCV